MENRHTTRLSKAKPLHNYLSHHPPVMNILQQRIVDRDRAANVRKVARNQAGRRFALILDSRMTGDKPCAGTYGVWTEGLHYAGHIKGGIASRWCYCAMGLSLKEAEALFARKLAGKQRP
jgi:hypothetical protein